LFTSGRLRIFTRISPMYAIERGEGGIKTAIIALVASV